MTKKWNHIRQSELQCAVCHVYLVACMLWTSQANTNVERGRRSGASSIQDCQAACINNTQCTGLDWNSTAELGQRCSLSGPWSGSRYDRVTPGVTHFDLNRNCLQTGIFFRNFIPLSSIPKLVVAISSWSLFLIFECPLDLQNVWQPILCGCFSSHCPFWDCTWWSKNPIPRV